MASPQIEIVVVSMADAIARRERMAQVLSSSLFPWRFRDASPGDGTIVPYDGDGARRLKGRDLYASERGCFESHVGAMREFLSAEDGADFLLMCEDDVFIDFDFPFGELAGAMAQAGVDYVRLFSRRIAPARHLQFWRNRWLVRFMWEPFGTQCYMVSRAGAGKLAPFVSRISRPIDDQLDRFWENGIPPYAIFPFPLLELQSSSSILRPAIAQAPLTRARGVARRLLDRARAVACAARTTETDRAFAQALRQTGI